MECELHDVGHRCFLRLPNDDQVWTIGLSVTEELTGCVANLVYSSELVVIFFSVQYRSDGHWVTPHPDLPLVLNGETLLVSTLFSHGSVLMVGDHTLTYTIKMMQPSQPEAKPVMATGVLSTPTTSPQPPPKPARQGRTQINSTTLPCLPKPVPVFESSSDTTEGESLKKPTSLKAQHEADKNESDLEKSMEVFMSLKDSLVNTDVELLNHVDTPEQMANVCSSYLFQFLLSKGFTMSAREMDSMHQSMQIVSMDQAHTLLEFLRGMKNKDVICDNDHSPFLRLINDVLLFTMDFEVSSETCMKVLVHVSAEPAIARHLSKTGMVPIVSACSAVYPNNVHVQTMLCRLYGNIVEARHTGDKCPLKEAAVDLILRALAIHQGERPFLRAALRILCAITRLHHVKGKRDVTSEVMVLSDSMLTHMEEHVLLVIQGIHNCSGNDKEISDMCIGIMEVLLTYRGDGSYAVIDYNELNYFPGDGSCAVNDNNELNQRSDSPRISNMDESNMNMEYSKADTDVKKVEANEGHLDTALTAEGDNTIESNLYAKVQKLEGNQNTSTEEYSAENDNLGPVQFDEGLNCKCAYEQADQETALYEDVIDETADALGPDVEQASVFMVHNEPYGNVDDEKEDMDGKASDLENSLTESELELKHDSSVTTTQVESDEDTASDQDEDRYQEGINTCKDPDEILGMCEHKVKKSALFKKKIGGYLTKLKPNKKKKKQHLPDSNDTIDDRIDVVLNTGDDVTLQDTIMEFPIFIHSPDQNHECADHLMINPPEAGSNQMQDNSSANSDFELPPNINSDSDSIESEFRLSPGIHGLDHDLSESEEEHEFLVDVEEDFGPFSENKTVTELVQNDNISDHTDLNGKPEDNNDHVPIKQCTVYHSSDPSSSDDSDSSTEENVIPDSQSEYSDDIVQAMKSRTGKKVAWVSTLKRIYEKPTSKFKKAVGLSNKVNIVHNPVYHVVQNDHKSTTKVLLTEYRSTENLHTADTLDDEEYSGTESERADRGNGKCEEDNPKKKLTKFEALKQKNQRGKLERFPWSPKSKW